LGASRRHGKAKKAIEGGMRAIKGSLDTLEMLRFSTRSKIWENLAKAGEDT